MSNIQEEARKLVEFLHRYAYRLNGWLFKNVVLGLTFLSKADGFSFGKIVGDIFGEETSEYEFDRLDDLCSFYIKKSDYPWVNDFIKWKTVFDGVDTRTTNDVIATLVDEIDVLRFETDMDIGDLYQTLIDRYGVFGGKAWGEFYTPRSAVKLITSLWNVCPYKKENPVIYDPSCGCGNLFMVADGEYYGQDVSPESFYICKMNMILNNKNEVNLKIGDTLVTDHFKSLEVDLALLNPPFNLSWNCEKCYDYVDFVNYGGYPPNGFGDIGFMQRCLAKLKPETGVGFGVFYPNLLARKAGEKKIREHLIRKRYIQAVIDLPSGLFLTTPISTSLVIFTKHPNDKILFINALEFGKKTSRGVYLTEGEIAKITDIYKSFLDGTFVPETRVSSVIKMDHPNTMDRFEFSFWSLVPMDHIKLTDEEVFAFADLKKLSRHKVRVIHKRYQDRRMYVGEEE